MTPLDLDVLAAELAETFPGRSDAPLARVLLGALVDGQPVTAARLAEAAGRRHSDVQSAVDGWRNVEYDAHGAVVAFSGLSLIPTSHRFDVGGRELFTWCAWDTLFLPALLDRSAQVRSSCLFTDAPVELSIDPGGVRHADPSGLRVTFPDRAHTSAADIRGSFCCHVHFVAGNEAAERWSAENPAGYLLDLPDAYALGARATASLR